MLTLRRFEQGLSFASYSWSTGWEFRVKRVGSDCSVPSSPLSNRFQVLLLTISTIEQPPLVLLLLLPMPVSLWLVWPIVPVPNPIPTTIINNLVRPVLVQHLRSYWRMVDQEEEEGTQSLQGIRLIHPPHRKRCEMGERRASTNYFHIPLDNAQFFC